MRSTLVLVLLALSVPLIAADSISVTTHDVDDLDAAGNVDLHYTVRNNAAVDLTNVTAESDFQPGFAFVGGRGAECAMSLGILRCTLPPIAAGQSIDFDLVLKPPAGRGHFFVGVTVMAGTLTASAFSHVDLYAPFVVTTTADDGPGSLRQAIASANRDCIAGVPCRITFAIQEPLPERGWYTIEPQSPLLPIGAFEIVIDGKRNNSAPVELRGTHAFGDGLVLRGLNATLTGLSIDGFFNNGVVVDGPTQLLIANNIIGSDPSGAPAPNGLRGIAVVSAFGTIRDNTISGNARSGIFVTSSIPLKILSNRITNNGASGIYVGPKGNNVDIQGNVIAGNHDFAVGTDAGAIRVAVRDNAMVDNGAPFDIGMDGPGLQTPPRAPIETAPAIASAVYDVAGGDTVITIDVNPVRLYSDSYTVYVFANHGLDRAGRAEAETFLGAVSTRTETTVVFRAHADLRGQIITALTLRSSAFDFDIAETSSELSEGVVAH